MGTDVLRAKSSDPFLRAYAHCTPTLGASQGEVTLLLINLHAAKSYQVRLRSARSPSSVEVVEDTGQRLAWNVIRHSGVSAPHCCLCRNCYYSYR